MDDRADRFVRASALLTGFGRVALLGTAMTDDYLRALDAALPAGTVDDLLAACEERGAEAVMADERLAPVARSVIVLWYCGTLDGRVLSMESYLAGLQWVAAGAHPVGARQQGYGAWAVAPEAVGA